MHKQILLFIVLLGNLLNIIAQNNIQRADDFFNKKYYVDAIALYQIEVKKNRSKKVIQNLADCYYHTFDMKSAARWYKYLIANYGKSIDSNYYFKFSQSLKATGEYDQAKNILKAYYKSNNDYKKLQELQDAIIYLENVRAIGNRFNIKNLPLNTKNSEFGAIKFNDKLVYTATKKATSSKKYRWNNQNYLDIYTHPFNELKTGDSISKSIKGLINTKLHEGAFTFSKNGKKIYFTRNNFSKGKRKTDNQKVSNLKIYSAELVDDEWKNITELPFNDNEFSTAHPTINADGTKLYFSSDRPGGYGSFDLYQVDITPNGNYGNPINLGKVINTDKKEQFPFIAENNILYFSSNGHPGFGLLDIFETENKDGVFKKPHNIGLPVNSGYDDFSYVTSSNVKVGYFSSNRPTGIGSDDIYSFEVIKELIIEDCKQYITGTITDKTTETPLANVQIQVKTNAGALMATHNTNSKGNFEFQVNCGASFIITAEKNAYEANSKNITTTKIRNRNQDASMSLYSIIDSKKAKKISLEKTIAVEKERVIELEKKRIQAEKEAAKKELENKVIAEKERIKRIQNTINTESAIVKDKERIIIKTEEIHFDYNLWYLRRETRERLSVVLQIMKNHPNITIQIGSHTDIRGNENYNKQLSQKRANSVKEYLVEKGITKDRIIAIGYGESQPIVKCKTEENCTEEDHEWNRRCEFTIVKWE